MFFCLFRSYAGRSISFFLAYGAISIVFFFFSFCLPDTLWFFCYWRIADFAYISARCPLCGRNITANFVMFVLAVQFLSNTASFFAALVAANVRFFAAFSIAFFCMLMYTVCHQLVTLLRVHMVAWHFCCPLAVAASVIVLDVVFTKAADVTSAVCIACKCHGWQERYHHAQTKKC